MPPAPSRPRIRCGYAPDAKAEGRLRAAGVRTIYLEGRNSESLSRIVMRRGEFLGVVDGYRAFGKTHREIAAALDPIHKIGATVIDVETGQNSRDHGHKMFSDALSPPKPSAEHMQMMSKAAAKRLKGRMPKAEALVIWRNPKLSTSEAIDLMKGWKQATAYNQLGKRFAITGRRPKP